MYCRLLLIILLFQTFLLGQKLYNDQGHIPLQNQVNWRAAGLYYPSPEQADFIYDITQQTASTLHEKIMDAISIAKLDGGTSIIYFPTGTYDLYQTIILDENTGGDIIFQGDGTSTIINFHGNENTHFVEVKGEKSSGNISASLGINKGDSLIYSPGIGNTIVTSDWIHFFEDNNPWLDNDYHEAVGQITLVEQGSANEIEMKDEASKSYSTVLELKIAKIIPIMNVGFENFRIYRVNQDASNLGSNFYFEYAVNCWMRGVNAHYTCRHHVEVRRSSHIEISGCFFDNARDHSDNGGRGSGVVLSLSTTNSIVVNNIFKLTRHAMVVEGGANCNVIIYNYSREREWTNGGIHYAGICGDLSLHGNYPYANLLEHNWVESIIADDATYIVGGQNLGDPERYNGPYNALVRNVACKSDGYYTKLVLQNCPQTAVLGNTLEFNQIYPSIITAGTTSFSEEFFGIRVLEGQTYETGAIIDHNWMWAFINFYTNPAYAWLKDISYYYSEAPYFLDLSVYSFPSLGPLFSSYRIPAKDRYGTSNKTYNTLTTEHPPLSVYISGVHSVSSSKNVTLTANVTGGATPYHYQWQHMWTGSGGGPIDPFGPISLGGGGVIPMAPIGTWNNVGTDSPSLTFYVSADSDFRVTVTDANSDQVIDTHIVDHPGGGGIDLSMGDSDNQKQFVVNIPEVVQLIDNYPNPFNPTTTIKFGLPEAQNVTIEV